VLKDLEPYQCIQEDCNDADRTYPSRALLNRHYRQQHSIDTVFATSVTCIFCSEPLVDLMFDAVLKHICRHMEDIAFATVSRVQVEWHFYSELESSPSLAGADRKPPSLRLDSLPTAGVE
jgi:hypothetical protein